MRFWILIWAMLLAGANAQAAPTCLDKSGGTIRCNTQGAMPVGWQPSPQTMAERSLPPNPGVNGPPGVNGLLKIALGLAAIFALIALLPDFDGDWEQRGKDDDTQR